MPRYKYSTDELMQELSRLKNELNRFPSYTDMQKHGRIKPKNFQNRFGTWEDVKRQIGYIPRWETFNPELIAPEDGFWLAGIVDGEGCFSMRKPTRKHSAWDPIFCLSFRMDDEPLLDELIRILDIGTANKHIDWYGAKRIKGQKANPAVKFNIYDVPTLHCHLVASLKNYPLRSKKRFEFKVFELAVSVLWEKRSGGRKNCVYTAGEHAILSQCYYILKEMKRYNADYPSLLDGLGLSID